MVFTKTAVMLGRTDSLSTTEFFLIKQDIPHLKHQQDTQSFSAFYLESSVFSIQGRLVSSSYDKLGVSGFIHYRINHSKEFADRQNHINGIENFWNQAKRVLRKYNGIDRKSFPLFLKECEFRFNFGTPSQQLKILRDWCGI